MFDVAIIGAGIIGCACAYKLSQYNLSVALIDRENDISLGATRANSAIIHAGFDPEPNTLMAKLNVDGNAQCKEICKKLGVECKEIGSLVTAFDEDDMKTLQKLLENGRKNGVPGIEIWTKEQVLEREPNLSKDIIGALWAPSAAITNPWQLALAMAEVAVVNGCKPILNFDVSSIKRENSLYILSNGKENVRAKFVINAAGVFADKVSALVSSPTYKIIPTAGEYYLLDKSEGNTVSSVIFPCPSKKGKGVLISPTVHGNLIVGPNAQIVSDAEDTKSTASGLAEVREKASKNVPCVNLRQNIRNFTGIRANSSVDDFIIEFRCENFLDLAGIRSPGLSSAPAIADMAVSMLSEKGLCLEKKENFIDKRKKISFKHLSESEKKALIEKNPKYGRVICRCETITEGEIIDAINSPIPPCSVDGIKRRAGSGMGRCQGGFCAPKVVEILAREKKISPLDVLQDKNGSYILINETKQEG